MPKLWTQIFRMLTFTCNYDSICEMRPGLISYLFKKAISQPLYLLMFGIMLSATFIEKTYIPSLLGDLISAQTYKASIMYQFIGVNLLKEFVLYRAWHYLGDSYISPRMRSEITKEAMEQLLKTKFTYHDQNSPPELNAKIESLHKTVDTIEIILNRFIAEPIGIIIYLYSLWKRHWLLSMLVLLWLINFGFCMTVMVSSKIRELSEKWAEICVKNSGRRTDLLRNIFNVKIFSNLDREMRFVRRETDDEMNVKCQYEVMMFRVWYWIWASYYSMLCIIVFFFWRQNLPISDLITTIVSLEYMAWSIMFIAYNWSELVGHTSAIRNGLTIFDGEIDYAAGNQNQQQSTTRSSGANLPVPRV